MTCNYCGASATQAHRSDCYNRTAAGRSDAAQCHTPLYLCGPWDIRNDAGDETLIAQCGANVLASDGPLHGKKDLLILFPALAMLVIEIVEMKTLNAGVRLHRLDEWVRKAEYLADMMQKAKRMDQPRLK